MSLCRYLVASTTAVLTVLALAPLPAQAAPAALDVRGVTGTQTGVSCLSTKLCVLVGYNSFGTGDVVAVRSGTPKHRSTVRKTSRLYDVSCPNSSGCIALADSSTGAGAEFVNINHNGEVNSTREVSVPAGDTINEISCIRLTRCEVAGTNLGTTRWKIVAGIWNGRKLSLSTVSSPKNTSFTSILAVSCDGGNCDVVGYSTSGAKDIGLSLVAEGTKLGKPHTANGDALYGVSCVSKSTCYGSGFDAKGGIVVTIKNGAIGSPSTTKDNLFGIACSGSECIAAGLMIAPENSGDNFWGTLLSVSAGKITGTTVIKPSMSLNEVARIGTFYSAVGAGQVGRPTSELVTS